MKQNLVHIHPAKKEGEVKPAAAEPPAWSGLLWRKLQASPFFLWAGLLCGFMLAVSGILESRPSPEGGIIAVVNGVELKRSGYNKHLAAVAGSSKSAPDAGSRRYVLDRMIEEELLLQRAMETGILARNKTVRGNMTRAMIDNIIAEAKAEPVTEADLKEFFTENRGLFTRTGRIRTAVIRLQADTKQEAAAQRTGASALWTAQGDLVALREQFAASEGQPILPDAFLPPKKITDYIGPALTRAVLGLGDNEMSDVVEHSGHYYLVFRLGSVKTQAAGFQPVREQVEFEYRRRRSDTVLREYINWLKDRAAIERVDEL